MHTAECDPKGRIYLRLAVRERYGTRFRVVQTPDEVILLPIPADPVKDLRELGKTLSAYTVEQLRKLIDEQAMKEVARRE